MNPTVMDLPISANFKDYHTLPTHSSRMYLQSALSTCTGRVAYEYFGLTKDSYKGGYDRPTMTTEAYDEAKTMTQLRASGVRWKIISDIFDVKEHTAKATVKRYSHMHGEEVRRMTAEERYRKTIQDLLFKRKPRNLG